MALITALLVMLLISSIIVGFSYLVMTDQSMGGFTNQRQKAFYGAEAGMEKLTADINNLFGQNYAPTGAEVDALAVLAQNPVIPGVSYIDPALGGPGSGYAVAYPKDGAGNPLASNHTITSGPYQGLVGLLTPYQLTVIAQSATGSEVKLRRTVNTVGIPIFQFGIFSQTELSFFAGPNFNFGGRVHTNGNLFLAEGDGSTLTMGDKVTAVGEVIRTNLSNGWNTNTNYNGVVNVLTAPGSWRAMAKGEGSLTGTLGSGANAGWSNLSIGTYKSYIRDGDITPWVPNLYTGVNGTGARALNLAIATPQLGGSPIDLIRRPVQNENIAAPGKLGTRYFSQASLRIMISDNSADIANLPCVTAAPPVDLSQMAQAVVGWPAAAPYSTIVANAGAAGTTLVPLAASGGGATYSAANGYWLPAGTPLITGFIKIEAQTAYGVPCGTYVDVTNEILALGYAGRNLYPVAGTAPPTLPGLPAAQVAPSACSDPNPNAVIRLERVRDNPSTRATGAGCGVGAGVVPPLATDYWPNVLFDPREAVYRDVCPDGTGGACKQAPMLGGAMHYVELDVNNLTRWFRGVIGVTGPNTRDPNVSPNNFTVYFSDRRGNYVPAPLASGWPPASPSGNETGEYGFNDFVNLGNANGCPDTTIDQGELLDSPSDTTQQTYGAQAGAAPYPTVVPPNGVYAVNGLFNAMLAYSPPGPKLPQLSAHWVCANPGYIGTNPKVWPGWYVVNRNEARENPPLFFRRALKLVNGSTINVGVCPSGVNCGLAVSTENPLYVQGDFNAPGGAFVAPYSAASVVSDSFTFLSDSWNDVNSFISTYDPSGRKVNVGGVVATAYRVAIGAGKGISFPQPAGTGQDFGTDGGVHNFLRYIENWGGAQLNYRGSIVSLYYNRQASGTYKCCTTVYSPPGRGYNFDTDFLTPNLLPPRTPMFRDINTIGFSEYILPN
ncbi:MAG: hypothetical protein ACRD5M_04315 [Candidatus Acidiferrales bacterium]